MPLTDASISCKYPVLAPHCTLRKLENPYIFNIVDDQLYEVDDEAFELLEQFNGITTLGDIADSVPNRAEFEDFIDYLIEEGIILLNMNDEVSSIKLVPHIASSASTSIPTPSPSLRYLLLHITTKCNLVCKHCYLGDTNIEELDIDSVTALAKEFAAMQGLKLMISGGEPLLHSQFWDILESVAKLDLRIVLLSNGTLIDKDTANRLANYVHEVQISIDGTGSHDMLRGSGTFDRSMQGIRNLKDAGIDVSIATMVHSHNLNEFEDMKKMFLDIGVCQWGVDVPCSVGNLANNLDFSADLHEAAHVFSKYGFGGGAHESSGNYTCGSHLAAVMANGDVVRCAFFADGTDEGSGMVGTNEASGSGGNVGKGLLRSWNNLCNNHLWTTDKLDCNDCDIINDCRGGCRFRALQLCGSLMAPDPVMCYANGIGVKLI